MKNMRKKIIGCFFTQIIFLGFALLILPQSFAAETASSEQGMSLSLNQAIECALNNNIMMKLANQRIEESKGIRAQSGADLLPHVSLTAGQSRTFWENFAAQGMPEFGVIGPFNSFDARVQIVQRLFDFSAFTGFQAEGIGMKIARLKQDFAKQQVILSAVFAYLNVLNNEEKLRAVDEDINLAQQLVIVAGHQLAAGVVTELDVVRAKTRLAQQQAYRQDILQNLHAAYFQLMRITGLALGSDVKLSDSLRFYDQESLPLSAAVDTAFKDRIEVSLAKQKVRYQEYKLSQAKKQRLPTIDLYGHYGNSGETPDEFTHDGAAVGVQVSMPVFEGRKITGQVQQERSRKRSEELMRDDLLVQVEEDVRLALQTLLTSADQVKAAQEAFDLAKREVELAENQYHAGMKDNIAVVEAQTLLERLHEAYINAVMQHHLARVNYFSAIGKTELFHLNPVVN
jgi:outer membrane protein